MLRTIRLLSILVIVPFVLGACSSPDQSAAPEQTAMTTTTISVDCSEAAVEDAMGETGIVNCDGQWASVMPDSYTRTCTDCESVWLYKWESDSWRLKARCSQYSPIVSLEDNPCQGRTGSLQMSDEAELDELPPLQTLCVIWDANSDLINITRTGCKPTMDDIRFATTEICEVYYENTFLPLGRCDEGRGVKVVQAILVVGGAPIKADGLFGPGTVRAVMDFQEKNGLPESGYVDEPTWTALFSDQSSLPGTDENKDGLITPDEFG